MSDVDLNKGPWNTPSSPGTRRVATNTGPVTPAVDGAPPGWIISCQCGFRCDAHGATDLEALDSVSGRHHPGHALKATPVDYRNHPLYAGTEGTGS